MKLHLTILLMLFFLNAKSQLKIEGKSKAKISYSESDLIDFIHQNHFDYALIGRHYFYGQIFGTDDFCCLLLQNNKWYLAKISRTTARMEPTKISIKQHQLDKAELKSIKLFLNANSAFKYTTTDFNKLPGGCQYEKDGKMTGMSGVLDGSGFSLIQIRAEEVKSLFYSNPDVYLNVCYPSVKEFGILKGFVNTVNELYKQTNNLQN